MAPHHTSVFQNLETSKGGTADSVTSPDDLFLAQADWPNKSGSIIPSSFFPTFYQDRLVAGSQPYFLLVPFTIPTEDHSQTGIDICYSISIVCRYMAVMPRLIQHSFGASQARTISRNCLADAGGAESDHPAIPDDEGGSPDRQSHPVCATV